MVMRAIAPQLFTVGIHAVDVEIFGAEDDGATPDSGLAADATFGGVLPEQGAILGVERVDVVVVRADIDDAIGNGWRGAHLFFGAEVPALAQAAAHGDRGDRAAPAVEHWPTRRPVGLFQGAEVARVGEVQGVFEGLTQFGDTLVAL